MDEKKVNSNTYGYARCQVPFLFLLKVKSKNVSDVGGQTTTMKKKFYFLLMKMSKCFKDFPTLLT